MPRAERKLTKEQKRMVGAVASLKMYMNTYATQDGYESYRIETFVDDVLYGLGIALDPQQHKCADGFATFKTRLTRYLNGERSAIT